MGPDESTASRPRPLSEQSLDRVELARPTTPSEPVQPRVAENNNKGSRAKRYLTGGGTGRAELRGDCYLLEKKTGKKVLRFQALGETNWGVFGGGADKTLKGFANRIVSFLKGKY
jgi:hypothetical protein